MREYKDEYNICPHCGYFEGTPAIEGTHMEPGSILHDRYIVGRAVGSGGFGVTYVAWDAKLERKIAIKEYLPGEFSTRVPGRTQITVFSDEAKIEQFDTGKTKFIDEAQRLAKFQSEDGIVSVYDHFEDNGTAYIIMEFLEGQTLADYFKTVRNTVEPEEAIAMLLPIVRSLQAVHGVGIIHRDVAPDNIHIGTNGKIKLIDFGAARFATTNHSRSLTVLMKPGYSPEEQYRSRGDQGPHTDVYALGAVLYRMITGKTPPDALERRATFESKGKDILTPIDSLVKNIAENRATAIMNALNVRIENRTPDMPALERELTTTEAVERREGKIKRIDILKAPLPVKLGIGTAAAAVITLSVLLFTGVINFGPGLSTDILIKEGLTRVPSIVSDELAEADTRLTEASLLYAISDKEYSSIIPKDRILTQDIPAGSVVAVNSLVSVKISGGAETKIVGEYTGEDLDTVRLALEAQGFAVKVIQEYNAFLAPGSVIASDIEAGTELAVGAAVTLTISMGPDPSETFVAESANVPQFLSMSSTDAMREAANAGFVLKVSSREYSDTVPEGTIISQSLAAGTGAMTGDTIEIVVSRGAFVAYMPDVQYKSLDDAAYLIKAQQLTYSTTFQESETVQSNHVISQSIAAKTKMKAGDRVSLIISSGGKAIYVPDVTNGNLKLENARNTLTAAGFSVSVAYEKSDSVPEGNVIRQSMLPGTSAKRGEQVTLTVSSGKVKETVAVPDVSGTDKASAKSRLESAGFKVSTNDVNSETVALDYVISQSPGGGSEQLPGSTVILTVSKGAAQISVPNVVGLTQSMALQTLSELSLQYSVTSEFSKAEEKDTVIKQSPSAGTAVDKNSSVTLTISLGAKTNQMPDVTGQARSFAESAINALGLNLKINIASEYSDSVPEGSVVNQTPWAGSTVQDGESVTLTISQGGNPIIVPNVVAMEETEAQTLLQSSSYGLRVSLGTREFSETVPLGQVISQSPQSGTSAKKGDTVTLIVSKGQDTIEVGNYVGSELTTVKSMVKDFTITKASEEYSETILSGYIISQSPTAGSRAVKGSTVNVVISKGSTPVPVPDVTGKTQAQAETTLKNAGFIVTAADGTSMTVASGSVISQMPIAGQSGHKGDTVNITVSRGKPQVSVPNVVGSTQAFARSTIESALLVVKISEANDSNVPQGQVISQSPVSGNVDQGSEVTIVVSLGKADYTVPAVVGMTQSAGGAELTKAPHKFKPAYTTVYDDSKASGLIISTNPAAGTKTQEGATIEVLVSNGQKPVPSVTGMTADNAGKHLQEAGFTPKISYDVTEQYSDTYEKGAVISESPVSVQNPAANNTSYGSNKTVTLTVPQVKSKGKEPFPAYPATTGAGGGAFSYTKTERYDNAVPSGSAISQNPIAGSTDWGSRNGNVVVSKGRPVVPNVLNLGNDLAQSTIRAVEGAGFTVSATTVYHNTVDLGNVISQSVTGAQNLNTSVTLTVSKGKPIVPNVVGQNKATAETNIHGVTGAGFIVAYAAEVYDDEKPSGTVLSQSVTGEQNLNTVVTLTLSKGAQPTVPLNLIGMTRTNAENAISNAGLNFTVIEQESAETIGNVINISPSGGTRVDAGSTVTITVSKGKPLPDAIGRSQSDVEAKLFAAGFIVDPAEQQHSDDTDSGEGINIVVGYADGYSAGQFLSAGTHIRLIVKRGTTIVIDPIIDLTPQ
jgi:beta-lactam-binding protein with PASTA domain/predicted Ser/Thr protein kinase